jgi:hypothetical protein
MKKFRKIIITAAVLFAMMQPLFVNTAYAQFTILPSAGGMSMKDCTDLLAGNETSITSIDKNDNKTISNGSKSSDVILGCAIKTGRITLDMIPYFIQYFANFLLSISGLICVLFIVIGGYWYVFGGMMEQKDKGKKFIGNALKGMVVSILSWVIVTVVMNIVTS